VTRRWRLSPLVALAVLRFPVFPASPLAAQTPAAIMVPAHLAIEDEPAGAALRLLDAAGPLPFPIAVRVQSLSADPSPALDARLAAFERRKLPVWLSIAAPATADAVTGWRTALRGLLDRRAAGLLVLEVDIDQQQADVAKFAVQTAATELRAGGATARVAIGGNAMIDPSRRRSIYAADLAPYVDLLAVPADRVDGLDAWLHTVDLQAGLALRPPIARPLPGALVNSTLEDLGSNIAIRAWRPVDVSVSVLRALAPLTPLLTHQISVLDDEGASMTMMRGNDDVTRSVHHRLLFDTETFSTFLAYWSDRSADTLSISLRLAIDGTPRVLDVATGELLMANPFSAVPTPYHVEADGRHWYGNCAWDAIGICGALHANGQIATSCPDCGEAIELGIEDGHPDDESLLFHCLVPAAHWWDDIVFT